MAKVGVVAQFWWIFQHRRNGGIGSGAEKYPYDSDYEFNHFAFSIYRCI